MQARICPRCGRTDVHRSRRRSFFERLVFPLVLMRPYRCNDCNHRYLDFTFTHRVVLHDDDGKEEGKPKRRRKREPRPVGD